MRTPLSPEAITTALRLIARAFEHHQMPYQVVGGLATRAHGGRRAVVDLDFYAPLGSAERFLEEVESYMVWGPAHQQDESWDIRYMKLDIGLARVEIGDTLSSPKFFDQLNRCWVSQHIDFGSSVMLPGCGVMVSVMGLEELLDYKARLNRPVDLADIAELT